MKILQNPQIPRIKLVRNPYIRAISMFTDKIVKTNYVQNGFYVGWGMTFKKKPTFDDFVDQLHRKFQRQELHSINNHFATQFEHCWENLGLKFDYVLKIERLDFWYPCFVEELNLWSYVMRGWPDRDHCYFSSKDVPCNGPVQNEDGKLVFSEGQVACIMKV
eukprot:TRINITY_DN26030_c0_g1_i1.p2 TRINITY_DN26030_c0_g1~~TRINITY_DN26030_c0_g1_i1.p2  ORF type:complete len:162 (-),score=17.10 TRINITY_DN26030_c0_g1_i1:82-567(-)